ncbi:hypothetical protein V6N12_057363 [Hibiscus sabdariffa]|uniref:Uncharacterized protein n=1 Tax=Hibiscus sabdariffa TaxID=183260 RepID=A0ABR2DBM9_9ROSI
MFVIRFGGKGEMDHGSAMLNNKKIFECSGVNDVNQGEADSKIVMGVVDEEKFEILERCVVGWCRTSYTVTELTGEFNKPKALSLFERGMVLIEAYCKEQYDELVKLKVVAIFGEAFLLRVEYSMHICRCEITWEFCCGTYWFK